MSDAKESFPLDLNKAVTAVDVPPDAEITVKGSYISKHDGSTIDAATTTWPKDAPGGESVDPGGIIDWEAGGWHVMDRNPVTHVVIAKATGDAAPTCAAAGVATPCLPLRTLPQARSRLITNKEWVDSLNGRLTVEVPAPPPVPPGMMPYLAGAAAVLGAGILAWGGWRWRRRQKLSPAGQLIALADRVRAKLKAADPVLAAPLAPAVEAAVKAVQRKRVDPSSKEGQRVAEVLRRVELRIEAASAAEEQQAADELVQEVEAALEAADEMAPARKQA